MDFDLPLPSGRIRARSWGEPSSPLVLCVPGLAANLTAYTHLAEALSRSGRRAVAFDLRGTGRSEVSAPGSYGLSSHAADVVAVADALGARRFDLIGWSLGALVAMQVALDHGPRLPSVTLIDHAGPTDPAALVPIRDGLSRLEATVDDPRDYLAAVRAAGHIRPWSAYWDEFYRYELAQRPDGRWQPTTSREAAQEDLRQRWPRDWSPYWRALSMPATVVRAVGRDPLVVPPSTVEALRSINPEVRIVESVGDHFTCMTAADTTAAVLAGLSAGQD
ncbi:alpha/beta hydrolase [Mycobacterium sp. MS1601]|uniref:alpha/beta fold hydrolase n=1 Tax=Mycobacterium sp. MS1601 TaxID=1936029 RepID=UPI0009793E40|nr:alpha/beta fold hydrolase [Mycobacterium sp. MS1601]AQA05407.1 alpha/beta hydrolase [Mycobacterium sp. MS1601]